MPWYCYACNHPSPVVITAKFADLFSIGMGDLCLKCIQAFAEANNSMDKYDDIGIGYTKSALEEGALSLMQCSKCHRHRAEILLSKPDQMCCSCFTYFMYKDHNKQEGKL